MTMYSHDIQCSIPGRGTGFSHHCHIQTGFGLHAASCPVGKGSCLPEDRAAKLKRAQFH